VQPIMTRPGMGWLARVAGDDSSIRIVAGPPLCGSVFVWRRKVSTSDQLDGVVLGHAYSSRASEADLSW
jgi:hypothetical protein